MLQVGGHQAPKKSWQPVWFHHTTLAYLLFMSVLCLLKIFFCKVFKKIYINLLYYSLSALSLRGQGLSDSSLPGFVAWLLLVSPKLYTCPRLSRLSTLLKTTFHCVEWALLQWRLWGSWADGIWRLAGIQTCGEVQPPLSTVEWGGGSLAEALSSNSKWLNCNTADMSRHASQCGWGCVLWHFRGLLNSGMKCWGE